MGWKWLWLSICSEGHFKKPMISRCTKNHPSHNAEQPSKKEGQMFLGRDLGRHRDYSKVTAQKIDDEVRGIVVGGYTKAAQLIEDNLETLRKIVKCPFGERDVERA